MKRLTNAVAAGAYISIGAIIYLCIPNPIVASLFFATGIFLVFNFNNMLFTRVVPLITATKEYRLFDMVPAFFGNAIGAFLIAALLHFTRLGGSVSERLKMVVEVKLGDSWLSLFLMGVFCAILVSYAVLVGKKYKAGSVAQIFYVWLFITAFVFGGFDHIVANLFYLAAYGLEHGLPLIGTVKVLLMVTLGNIAGGLVIGRIERRHLPKEND